ncbi:MAG: hypothetical protein KatS3mg123_1474 [Burkholderiales bacterium]|nr:MAG: hypothetical protein KatS3mg123_1474 [Burkholderiales bacterium]
MRRDSWRSVPTMCKPPRRNHLVVELLPLGLHCGDALLLGRLVQGLVGQDAVDLRVRVAPQHDVGAAARHVGGDGDHLGPPRLGHDLRLPGVLLGVEHLVGHALLLEQSREELVVLDGGGAHQHRLSPGVAVLDVVDDRLVFLPRRAEHLIVQVLADHRLVGGNHHHLQAVDLLELVGLGVRRAGHAGELAVQAEVVLEGDRGERLVLLLDRHPFLRLHRLVQALRPAPAGHRAGR